MPFMKPFSLTYVRYPVDDVFGFFAALASLMPFCVIIATFGAFFARRELWDLGLLVGILANEVLAQFLKHVIDEPRPDSCALVDFCKTSGMPSSHASLAWFACSIAVLNFRRRAAAHLGTQNRVLDSFGKILVMVHVPIALAVSTSRVYLGYHSFAQVAAGSVLGLVAGAAWHFFVMVPFASLFTTLETSPLGEFLGIRDSSLVADPENVARKALAAPAKPATRVRARR
jgi:dolichyldiphosphatase|tara:strand:+ start:1058 stop:1744 length:687 start_codon:yes stop_codon:yes gene_type:complete